MNSWWPFDAQTTVDIGEALVQLLIAIAAVVGSFAIVRKHKQQDHGE